MSALRAIAMLLGITLHASMAYLARPLEGMRWVVQDTPSLVGDFAYWWVHAWRLPLFFFLAGFFAKLTMDRHGAEQFARKRFKRLVVPYIVAAWTIGPILYVVFVGGWYLTGQCTYDQMMPHVPLPPKLQENSFGPAHLWFLQDLIIMSSVYLFLSVVMPGTGKPVRETKTAIAPKWWMPIAAAIPTGLLLWSDLSPVIAHHNTFLADPPRLLYFTIYFIGGITAFQNREWFMKAVRFPKTHLLLSVPLGIVYLVLLRTNFLDLQSLTGRLVMGLTVALIAWLTIYGLMGCFLHHWNSEGPQARYIADSSYWMYLCHLPIVAALATALHWIDIPSVFKFLIVSSVTTVIGLLSYQLFVRYTIIGNYLHGPREKPAHTQSLRPTASPRPVR
ncbi:acyltransferase family protein [Fuerstiella marisgermanici]|nr:acyltransferase family protein [Fuerstiella marisgermanici]